MNMKTLTVKAFTKAVDEEARTVTQIVSVFGNVDLGKDRVIAGAFTDTLAAWKSSEDVLSAYFSHQWDNPFANIGSVIDAEQLLPGDERLPDDVIVTEDGKSLRDLGGLMTTYKFDEAGLNAFADQVFYLLKERRITQASFAYDVVENKRNSDGTNDLIKLNLLEVGPTLLGMNPATTTLSRKDVAQLFGIDESLLDSKDLNHTFIPSADDASKCTLCGKTARAVAHIMRLSDDVDNHGLKAVSFAGSLEERQQQVYELGRSWAQENDIGNGGFFGVYLEATFTDTAIFLVEGWSDPYGEGIYFEASIVDNEDGTISITDPTEVIVEQSVRPKSRAKMLASIARGKEAATLSSQEKSTDGTNPEAGNGNGEGENPEGESKPENTGEAERARLEADALLLDV